MTDLANEPVTTDATVRFEPGLLARIPESVHARFREEEGAGGPGAKETAEHRQHGAGFQRMA